MKSWLVRVAGALALAGCAASGAEPPGGGSPPIAEEAVAADGAAEPITLRWRATREDGVFGYIAYRAEQRQGPFVRLNDEIVLARADGAPVHDYELVDTEVEAGRTYHYYLDTVSTTGRKSRFSGVVSRTADAALPGPDPSQ